MRATISRQRRVEIARASLLLRRHPIDGPRIENASFTGGLLRGSTASPSASNNVEGTDDAAIYVGNSHDVAVERNHATDSTAGIEIENSTGVVVRGNSAIGNTSGIVSFCCPGSRFR